MRPHVALLLLALAGCRPPEPPPPPALLPGDSVQPQVLFIPRVPLTAGVNARIDILLQARRPGREAVTYLYEKDIPDEGVEMWATISFLAGGTLLGEPLKVPFVKDC